MHRTPPTFAPFDSDQQSPDDPVSSRDVRHGAERPGEQRFDVGAWRQQPGFIQPSPPDERTPPTLATRDRRPTRPQAADLSAPVPRPTSARPTPSWTYLGVWGGLGAASIAYLAAMTWQRASSVEVALAPVTEAIERIAGDIAELRQTTATLETRERATSARVAATETRIEGFAQNATHLPQVAQNPSSGPASGPGSQGQRPTNRAVLAEDPAVAPPAAQAEAGSPLPGVVVSSSEPLKPTRLVTAPPAPAATSAAAEPKGRPVSTVKAAPLPPHAPAAAPIRTGSLSPAAAPARPSGVLIASGPSLESIRLSWTVLNQTHAAVLGGLEPRILPADDGSAFHLIAGPFASDADAQKACAALKAKGVGCRAADFNGAAL